MSSRFYEKDLNLLLLAEHNNPHGFLGMHGEEGGEKVIRLWAPGAPQLHLEVRGKVVEASVLHPSGLFEYHLPKGATPLDYRVYHTNGQLGHDPYAFWPTCGELDQYLFGKGVHYELYRVLGARLMVHQGVSGVKFAVWAPSAKGVALVGDFNHWDGRKNPMRAMGSSGVWELFVPGLQEGEKYKYEIKTQQHQVLIKSDPYAFYSEKRPATASVVFDLDKFTWTDGPWLERQKEKAAKPMSIYEVHLGSWRKPYGRELNYLEMAEELAVYCQEMGFTHVELMPIAEHPLDESWGYQVTGFYAVTSRYGTPRGFQGFVNLLHNKGIGVILDWVPGHFPTDDFSLARFDGTALYEHEDPRQGFHPHWNTHIFNYGRHEVSNFLIANALFWMECYHIDALRVDAVASMLYLDYGRKEGEWIPNKYGGKENLEAIEFLKHLNGIVHEKHPGALMVAEESTSFTGVTHSLEKGGLGFDLKWNMGWMNDTLFYFQKDPLFRHYHHNCLTFGLIYAFSEKFILVFSHDEVVHGKRSLISKMPGDLWQKFANLRLLYSYMICQPGKKLLFMGGELGQWNEWYCKTEIEWHLLHYPSHASHQKLVKELNHFYLQHSALWELDFENAGFEWVDFSDQHNGVICYRRKSHNQQLLCLHHFSPNYHREYFVKLPDVASVKELFNTDEERFGGTGKVNKQVTLMKDEEEESKGFVIQLAPLSTQIFDITYG